MSSLLDQSYEKLKVYINGEAVGKRMVQLQDLSLDPEREYLIPSINKILETIENWEEDLLGRSQLDMFDKGSVLKSFRKAMRESSLQEWKDFMQHHSVNSLDIKENTRLFTDASGIVRNTQFKEWVLGLGTTTSYPEHFSNDFRTQNEKK